MKIIDAHSHIDCITHLFQPDVVGSVCCAENESQWSRLLNMDNIYPAFGIHPWFIDSLEKGYEERLYELLKTHPLFMVGEIGLDKYHPNMDIQMNVFIKQLEIAIKLKRTVFLHCVGAWDKILHILKQYKKSELPIIVAHAFNANDNVCNELLKYEKIFFSFNKIDKPREIHRIEQIPSKKILVETDGKFNIILTDVINKITSIKNDKNIPDIIYDNTLRILNGTQTASD